LLCLFAFWFVCRQNFARTTFLALRSLSPSCSSFLTLCHDSVLVLDSFCFGSLGLCWLSRLCYCFLFVVWYPFFSCVHCLTLCMMYALFVIHLIYT
jgi:hypothetical protein